jgi:predicted HicB family RNase H-like nuclease
MIRPSKEDGARIREEAAAAGQSVQNYILAAVNGQRETGPAIRLGAESYGKATAAAKAEGLELSAWTVRAIEEQAKREEYGRLLRR